MWSQIGTVGRFRRHDWSARAPVRAPIQKDVDGGRTRPGLLSVGEPTGTSESSRILGDELKVVDGAEAGAWINAAIGGEFGAVSRQVPKIFAAYARVFHRATDSDGNHVTWGEVAKRLGRTAHREMQWHQLVGTADTFGVDGSKWTGSIPITGELEVEELDCLCAVLADHTPDPERCFFGLCLINSRLGSSLSGGDAGKPLLERPVGRDHVVLAGPLSAVDQLVNTDMTGVTWAYHVEPGQEPPDDPPEPDRNDPFWREAPHLIWPADRSWTVVSEVDFDSTLVGGNRELIDALVASPDLEIYEVEPETSLAAFSDKVNWVPEPTIDDGRGELWRLSRPTSRRPRGDR